MNRRAFLGALTGGLLAATLTAGAQQPAGKVWRIGWLDPNTPASNSSMTLTALSEGLREHGFVEGQNMTIERRFADGDVERLPSLAAELVGLNVELIYTSSAPAALAVKHATSTIPIVFAFVHDPVRVGLVESLARPGGNATGLTNVDAELAQKRLAILKEMIPSARTIGFLKPPINPQVSAVLRESETGAKALGLRLQVEDVDGPEALEHAFAAMKKGRVSAVGFVAHPLFYTHRARLVQLTMKDRLPLMGFSKEFADAGALCAYGVSIPGVSKDVARYIAKILRGAVPGDLPVEQPTKLELIINLKTARALGLTVPQSILLRADEIIQ